MDQLAQNLSDGLSFGIILVALAGSLHCAGMCGPFVLAFQKIPTWSPIQFQIGRLIATKSLDLSGLV